MITNRLLRVIAPVGLVVVCALALRADEHDESQEPAPVVTPAVDSVYAAVNAGFQTVKPIFEHSCFDCHSRFTKYPWYHKLPLIKGMLDDHIKEGREHLDMSDGFPFSGRGTPAELLKRMKELIKEGEMPIWSYRLIHWGTSIEGPQRDSVFTWIDSSLALIDSVVPPEQPGR